MSKNNTLDIQEFIDRQAVSRFQLMVILLCFLTVAIDGIDIGLAAYIAPSVRHEWGLTVSQLSPLFVSGLIGMMVGAMAFGPMADRVGRRPVMLLSVAFFGIATLTTLFATNVEQLALLRFAAGIGIGGATPTAVTLTAEFSPSRRRLSIISIMLCGNSLGSAFGGVVASQVIPHFGWHAMLIVGGMLPLLLLPVLWLYLPESMRFLALRRPDQQQRLRVTANRITRQILSADTTFFAQEVKQIRSPIRELLVPRYLRGTLLLWTTFFMGLSVLFMMASWLPTIITGSGGSMKSAALITALWSVGGTSGGLLLGRFMDKARPHWVLAAAYSLGFVMIALVGQTYTSMAVLGPVVFVAGLCVSGSQVGINALAAMYYPTANRATGVAWASGIGRFGSMFGSAIGGFLLSSGLSYMTMFLLVALPALIASLCMFSMPAPSRQPYVAAPQAA